MVGEKPPLDYEFVTAPPYDCVVVGSASLQEVLYLQNGELLQALSEGKSVIFYTPGLPKVTANRGLRSSLGARYRELKSWGVVFTDGGRKRLITAQEARVMKQTGARPGPGAVLTPLAKEILEG